MFLSQKPNPLWSDETFTVYQYLVGSSISRDRILFLIEDATAKLSDEKQQLSHLTNSLAEAVLTHVGRPDSRRSLFSALVSNAISRVDFYSIASYLLAFSFVPDSTDGEE